MTEPLFRYDVRPEYFFSTFFKISVAARGIDCMVEIALDRFENKLSTIKISNKSLDFLIIPVID
ncbi:MAG: hypothetical protein KJO26_16390 [Deltaproteobacteria bacterium]|nr:hypothetical protein [Deltaproteobacteria bacterium]